MLFDLINGAFETLAGLFVLNHCRVLVKDKAVAGVSILSVAFFTAWGVWNLWYYPALGQTASFIGGLVVVAANLVYVGLLVRYSRGIYVIRLRRRLGSVVCWFRGHQYNTPVFESNVLYPCARCGREMFDRTFDDIEPLSDEQLEELHREISWEYEGVRHG